MANKRVGTTDGGGRRDELIGILAIGAGLIAALSVFTYSPSDHSWGSVSAQATTHNYAGPFGAYLSDFIFQLIGGAGFLIPLYLLVYGINRLTGKEKTHRFLSFAGAAVFMPS